MNIEDRLLKSVFIFFYNLQKDDKIQKYDHNSQNNIRKSIADHRTGNLNPNIAHAKGDKHQELACLEDGKIIERIYRLPKEEVKKRSGISIFKNPTDR